MNFINPFILAAKKQVVSGNTLSFKVLFTVAFAIVALSIFVGWKDHLKKDKRSRGFHLKLNKANAMFLGIVAMAVLIVGTWIC